MHSPKPFALPVLHFFGYRRTLVPHILAESKYWSRLVVPKTHIFTHLCPPFVCPPMRVRFCSRLSIAASPKSPTGWKNRTWPLLSFRASPAASRTTTLVLRSSARQCVVNYPCTWLAYVLGKWLTELIAIWAGFRGWAATVHVITVCTRLNFMVEVEIEVSGVFLHCVIQVKVV